MRTLLYVMLFISLISCRKQHDAPTVETPTVKKLEWHVYASEKYTQPWLDSLEARVEVRIYKTDTARHTSQTLWDTTFASRAIRQYPLLSEKYIIKKEVPVSLGEKLQVWYNIRYEMNGTASEMGKLQIVQEPFTFVDIRI